MEKPNNELKQAIAEAINADLRTVSAPIEPKYFLCIEELFCSGDCYDSRDIVNSYIYFLKKLDEEVNEVNEVNYDKILKDEELSNCCIRLYKIMNIIYGFIDGISFNLDINKFCNKLTPAQFEKINKVYDFINIKKVDPLEKINPWQLSGNMPVPEEIPTDPLLQDVFESNEEYANRIKNLPAIKIGEALLKKDYIDFVSKICMLSYSLDELKSVGKTTIYTEKLDAIYADLQKVKDFESISGDLVAKLKVYEGQVCVDYTTLNLKDEEIFYPLVAVKWESYAYESLEDYEERVSNLPVLPLGNVVPVRSGYKLAEEILPFKFVPYTFAQSISKDLKIELHVPVELAKKACTVKDAAVIYGKIEKNATINVIKVINNEYTIENEKKFISYKVGDIIEFGRYHIKDLNSIDAIKWKILDIIGNQALLISCEGLDLHKFDDLNNMWKGSSLRSWLNNTFFETAFSSIDKDKICQTLSKENCMDKVFVLSPNELTKYDRNEELFECCYTDYAMFKGTYSSADNCIWWTSEAVSGSNYKVICYDSSKKRFTECFYYSDFVFVRPAIWIKL